MTLVIVVEPGGAIREVDLPTDEALQLRELQAIVGGYLEVVRVPLSAYATQGLWLFCNEDGARLELPGNVLASAFMGQAVAGAVVFHGGADDSGALLPIPEPFRVAVVKATAELARWLDRVRSAN